MKHACLAASAALAPGRSVHTDTFRRAVELAAEWLKNTEAIDLEILWFDDSATATGALLAAERVLKSPAAAIVGHYSSAAAQAAAPLYSNVQRPLFLPAATAHSLTETPHVYRLCDSDRDYARWIRDWLDINTHGSVFVETDGSIHGESVRDELLRCLDASRLARQRNVADILCFSGGFEASLRFLQERLAENDRRMLLLTDDAQSDKLARATSEGTAHVRVMGFSASSETTSGQHISQEYRQRWKALPGIYFFETVAAVQVAAAWLTGKQLHAPVPTVLGVTSFDDCGESRPSRFACLYPEAGRLLDLQVGERNA